MNIPSGDVAGGMITLVTRLGEGNRESISQTNNEKLYFSTQYVGRKRDGQKMRVRNNEKREDGNAGIHPVTP